MKALNWRTLVKRLPDRIWFRLVVYAVTALALVAIARFAGPLLPSALAVDFGQDAALRILQILATSMLAVTTFSLTAMISAYAVAARGTTPRATQLLTADNTSQNALSTFLGTFVFSIVGVIALSTSTFTKEGRSLLFIGTLVVIAVVVGTLLRWIQHLTQFGQVPDVIDRVEHAATDAMRSFAREPHLGGVPPVAVADSALAVASESTGAVTGVAVHLLQDIADATDTTVHVVALPGAFVGRGTTLARVVGAMSEDDAARVRGAFRVEQHRTYEQDPRLGLVALAEIGSRAVSPAINDQGTAIEVLGAVQRVVTELLCGEAVEEVRCDRVHVPALSLDDLIEDVFRPLARDGAAMVEVGL
ncbi:MAG TPA: DUF2254 domain-containing protein, partial [Demequina sp.]|nr:DUF2254 domain-containing protein [Demequina sp.]